MIKCYSKGVLKMLYFHKLYYNIRSPRQRKSKAKERINYDSTHKTNLVIEVMDRADKFQLYYVPTNSTIGLIANISEKDIILENIYNNLPELARKNFFIDMLSQELQSTNELEGVRSSKEEIVRTTRKILDDKDKERINKDRFQNVIKSYLQLKNGSLKSPIDARDCRKIYDEITSDGISKENALDGRYFRKNITYVYKNNEKIHSGISDGINTEEVIIDKIDDLLNFMTVSNLDLHILIKIAISHYYFGYIHPFYDGNGRTGRFISSIFLKENYSWLTAMSLSQGSSKERSQYLAIFDKTNQVSSQGEINYFVDTFLSIILAGQIGVLESLTEKNDLLKDIMRKIDNDRDLTNDDEKVIMEVMAQEYYFNFSRDGIGVRELKEVFSYTDNTIRNKLKGLHEKDLIYKVKGRPVKYILSENYLEN